MTGEIDFMTFNEEQYSVHVKKRPWMEDCTFTLGTKDNLADIIDDCLASPDGHNGLDLETTGLDSRVFNGSTVDKIVGVCLCPSDNVGYYIPIAHSVGTEHNVPWELFKRQMGRLFKAAEAGELIFDFHGGNFDQEFLEFNGDEPLGEVCWDRQKCWDDTEILAYLDNPRRRDKRLKSLSEELCGITQIHIHELWGHDRQQKGFKYDFSQLDPSRDDVLWYGGGDGIATYRLRKILKPLVVDPDEFGQHQRTVYAIEKSCIAATRWMRRNRIHIDRAKVMELIILGQTEWFESICEVYEAAKDLLGRDVQPGYYKFLSDIFVPDDPNNLLEGQLRRAKAQAESRYPNPIGNAEMKGSDGVTRLYPWIYDINAPQQLGKMFEEMGVPGLKYTDKSGQVKTSKDELDRVVEEASTRFPFMGKIKRFREISKALSNYLLPMLTQSEPSDDTIAINFRGQKVDTGRFATPASGKNILGWPQMNLQSVPSTYDPKRPKCMTRIRECVVAPEGWYIVAIDYAGVELRIVTNLSREPKWTAEYFRCSSCSRTFPCGDGKATPEAPPPRCPNCGSDKIGDLHTLTALSVYGSTATEKPDWKQLRNNAKGTNFSLCYGGGGNAVVRSCGVSKNEGWRIKRVFDETYGVLRGWWARQHQFARQHKYVKTAFSRKYPVPDIDHADGGFRSKAERNSVNGPIQGTSADIIKMVMAMIYKECKKRGWMNVVRMIITMHDELVFEIHGSILEEALVVINHIMTRNSIILQMQWPIPFTTDTEIGHNWTVPWDLNAMRAGEVRFNGDKKYYDPKQAEADGFAWDDLTKFPGTLVPWFHHTTFESLKSAEFTGKAVAPAPEVARPEPSEVARPEPSEVVAPVEVQAKAMVLPSEPPAPTEPPQAAPVALGTPPPAPVAPAPTTPAAPPAGLKKGDVFTYTLNCPLTLRCVRQLARVMLHCKNSGTKQLKVLTRTGTCLTDLPEWAEFVTKEPIMVNEGKFFYLAQDRGL